MKKILSIGLLMLLSASCLFGQSKVLDDNSGLFIYLKGSNTKITEDDYLIYAKGFERDTYNKYKNDEFEWHDKFQILKQNLDKKIADADLTSSYTVVTGVDFGDYDFTNEGFPVTIGEGTFFPLGYNDSYYEAKRGSVFNSQTALKLDGFHKYNFIKLPKDEAKTFLQSRKDRYGNVDRSLTLQITYKIASYDSKEYKDFANLALSNNYIPVVGIIENIDVYDANDSRNVKKLGTLIKK